MGVDMVAEVTMPTAMAMVTGVITVLIRVTAPTIITGIILTGAAITTMPITIALAIIIAVAMPMAGQRVSPALRLLSTRALPTAAVRFMPAEDIPAADITAVVMGAVITATAITGTGGTTVLIRVIIPTPITDITPTGAAITTTPITILAAVIITAAMPIAGQRISPALRLLSTQAFPTAAGKSIQAEDIPAADMAVAHTSKAANLLYYEQTHGLSKGTPPIAAKSQGSDPQSQASQAR